jgi:hypothetical protein
VGIYAGRRGPSEQKILEDRGHFGLISNKICFPFCVSF